MDKKILGIILVVLVVAIAGLIYFGYQKGFLSGGIRGDSIMGVMKEKGETVMSKSEFVDKCKESDKDTQDMCYGMGAFYYRDASFCKLMKDAEAKKNCTSENIEKWYTEIDKGGTTSPFLPGGIPGGTIPGGGMFPDVIPDGGGDTGTGTIPGDGQEEEQTDPYGSAEETAAPAGLPSELKSIFSGVCGEAKLTILNYNFPAQGSDMLVYVWKNKPTEEKLTSAFEENGYELEGAGEILYLRKGNTILVVDWASSDREEGQEIVVLAGKAE